MNEPPFEELDQLGFDLWSSEVGNMQPRWPNIRDIWSALDEGERNHWRLFARRVRPLRCRVVELEEKMATALQHLEKGRALWNGPSHQCASVLRDALGMGEQSAQNTASPWREQAKFWEDQTAALRAQNAELTTALARALDLIKTQAQYRADHGSRSEPLPWISEAYRVIDAAIVAAGHTQESGK